MKWSGHTEKQHLSPQCRHAPEPSRAGKGASFTSKPIRTFRSPNQISERRLLLGHGVCVETLCFVRHRDKFQPVAHMHFFPSTRHSCISAHYLYQASECSEKSFSQLLWVKQCRIHGGINCLGC
ncbi:hypothetical protein Q8A67_022618 [Cirrhinus molitorella]|uniref:Uncharacterized protein n=1 Tax=Cirrhinus molitorella TaxID=172907 RepID=A0AA88P234_9TELE|nr:hypothetical protein Q8A67_022618 [Cirrhinus molitorella]